MRKQIKNEKAKWVAALKAGDVAEMVRCSERLDRMVKIQRTLDRANATLAPLLMGDL